ncbi:unnamed protein product, partial [Prorocentrum cordatum]
AHAILHLKSTILGKSHYLLFHIVPAMHPRWLITVDEDLKELKVPVRVGQSVDITGQAGRPKQITGFQTRTTPVLLNHTDRAELATEEYLPVATIMEDFVILRKNPNYKPTAMHQRPYPDMRARRYRPHNVPPWGPLTDQFTPAAGALRAPSGTNLGRRRAASEIRMPIALQHGDGCPVIGGAAGVAAALQALAAGGVASSGGPRLRPKAREDVQQGLDSCYVQEARPLSLAAGSVHLSRPPDLRRALLRPAAASTPRSTAPSASWHGIAARRSTATLLAQQAPRCELRKGTLHLRARVARVRINFMSRDASVWSNTKRWSDWYNKGPLHMGPKQQPAPSTAGASLTASELRSMVELSKRAGDTDGAKKWQAVLDKVEPPPAAQEPVQARASKAHSKVQQLERVLARELGKLDKAREYFESQQEIVKNTNDDLDKADADYKQIVAELAGGIVPRAPKTPGGTTKLLMLEDIVSGQAKALDFIDTSSLFAIDSDAYVVTPEDQRILDERRDTLNTQLQEIAAQLFSGAMDKASELKKVRYRRVVISPVLLLNLKYLLMKSPSEELMTLSLTNLRMYGGDPRPGPAVPRGDAAREVQLAATEIGRFGGVAAYHTSVILGGQEFYFDGQAPAAEPGARARSPTWRAARRGSGW